MRVLSDGSRECALMVAADGDLFGSTAATRERKRAALRPLRTTTRPIDDEALSFDGVDHAVRFLGRWANDHSERQHLREVLADVRAREDLNRFSDEQVMAQVAELLARGVLRAVIL